jgi:hypothetical protein
VVALSRPLKVLGPFKMGFDPLDSGVILDQPCIVCGEGIVRSVGMELFCTHCLTAFVEESINPNEVAYREHQRRAHSRR